MKWKLTLSPLLTPEQHRDILKKHYIIKEPFSKVAIHEMHVTELVENFMNSKIEVHVKSGLKEIKCLPAETD